MSAGSLGSVPTEGGSQLKVMEAGVNANAMKYNEIKLTADRKMLELQQRQTVLDSLTLEVRTVWLVVHEFLSCFRSPLSI